MFCQRPIFSIQFNAVGASVLFAALSQMLGIAGNAVHGERLKAVDVEIV